MKTKQYTPEQVERMLKRDRMSLCTQPGMLVVFVTFNAGYDCERKEMERLGFVIGHTYRVTDMSVGRSSSSVSLLEPRGSFNTVFFCNVPRQKLGTEMHGFNYSRIRK